MNSAYNEYLDSVGDSHIIKTGTFLPVKIKKLHSKALAPVYATPGSACFDIFSVETKWIRAGFAEVFDTGLAFEIPDEYVLMVFSRSGHGFKRDIRLGNCVGIIDPSYRGEVKVKLRADGDDDMLVEVGDRIAQGIILPYPHVEFEMVSELSETARGTGGFGSTGK